MSPLITDEIMQAIAVMRPRREVAAALRDRLAGLADAVSLVNSRHPDPGHFGDIVADLRGIEDRASCPLLQPLDRRQHPLVASVAPKGRTA